MLKRRRLHDLGRQTILQDVWARLNLNNPNATAVKIEEYADRPDGSAYIRDAILVERESQKPIVIGRAGSMIKQIGMEARLELESFFATKVFLDLRVKTRAGWREDTRVLDQLGVIDDD